MQSYLISKDLDNLLLLDVINEDFREQSKLISILISSITQQSPLLNIYEEKKKLLLDTLNSQRVNEKNRFREKMVSVFLFIGSLKFFVIIKIHKKRNEGIKGFNFSSNIDFARKSMSKVMNHRIEKLSSLLNANETQLNLSNRNEVTIKLENALNETSDNACSSTIKVESLSIQKSESFKVNSSIKEHQCETSSTQFTNSSQLKEPRFTCDHWETKFVRSHHHD